MKRLDLLISGTDAMSLVCDDHEAQAFVRAWETLLDNGGSAYSGKPEAPSRFMVHARYIDTDIPYEAHIDLHRIDAICVSTVEIDTPKGTWATAGPAIGIPMSLAATSSATDT